MSSVVISGDTSGTLTLTVPAVAGTNTATLPLASGTVMVSGAMPAFSVYASATTTISSNTYTKVQLNTKTAANNAAFDTAGYFDNATNYRFTPLIAGYYQINSSVAFGATTVFGTGAQVAIYKNGSTYKSSGLNNNSASTQSGGVSVADVIYFNGSTDYIELYIYIYGGTGPQIVGGSNFTFMSGVLVRTA